MGGRECREWPTVLRCEWKHREWQFSSDFAHWRRTESTTDAINHWWLLAYWYYWPHHTDETWKPIKPSGDRISTGGYTHLESHVRSCRIPDDCAQGNRLADVLQWDTASQGESYVIAAGYFNKERVGYEQLRAVPCSQTDTRWYQSAVSLNQRDPAVLGRPRGVYEVTSHQILIKAYASGRRLGQHQWLCGDSVLYPLDPVAAQVESTDRHGNQRGRPNREGHRSDPEGEGTDSTGLPWSRLTQEITGWGEHPGRVPREGAVSTRENVQEGDWKGRAKDTVTATKRAAE